MKITSVEQVRARRLDGSVDEGDLGPDVDFLLSEVERLTRERRPTSFDPVPLPEDWDAHLAETRARLENDPPPRTWRDADPPSYLRNKAIVELHRQGVEINRLATFYGLCSGSIELIIRRLDPTLRPGRPVIPNGRNDAIRRMRDEGATYRAIAERFNLSIERVRAIAPQPRPLR